MRVLLVEDDAMIGETVQAALQDEAFAVDWVRSGPAASSAPTSQHYDLALLDLGLPGHDGLHVLRQWRARGLTLPVLILTARDALADRLAGLDGGADDYILKPFDMAELLARMRAVWRRQSGAASAVLRSGDLTLDTATHEASAQGGPPVALSRREFALLAALMARPGAILSRAELEDRIYGWGEEVESNAIDFLIHGLRRKLGAAAIKNVRGAGWMVPKTP